MTPTPGSAEEIARFEELQALLPGLYNRAVKDPRADHTVLVVPSLSLDPRELNKISGVHHYEERLLFFLMLLRRPRTKLVFVTSQPLSPMVVDYYLHLLSGVPTSHARKRLLLLHCADASTTPLSAKILARPRLMHRLARALNEGTSHMICFNSTSLERTLSVQLNTPLYANDPALHDLGTKSGCREVFKEAGIQCAPGFERLHTKEEIASALSCLHAEHGVNKAVVKLNDGFSGEGNAIFRFDKIDGTTDTERKKQILALLPNLAFEAATEEWDSYEEKYQQMGGIVEGFISGEDKKSPSVQLRINAIRNPQAVSTHDQVLGGPSGQVFLGASFPADPEYRMDIQAAGMEVGRVLARRGAMGRLAVDFVSVRNGDGWEHHAIEINLRKGGTTHPFATLAFLTDGEYDATTGEFLTQSGRPRHYFASDNLQSDRYKGLLPEDLIDIAVYHDLHFHSSTERGVVFHLVGALSEFGKLGVVCIGDNAQQARFLYKKVGSVLDQETS